MTTKIQIIDDDTGETIDTCSLDEFLAANVDDDDVCDVARALKPGETVLIGGGAAPLMRLVGIGDSIDVQLAAEGMRRTQPDEPGRIVRVKSPDGEWIGVPATEVEAEVARATTDRKFAIGQTVRVKADRTYRPGQTGVVVENLQFATCYGYGVRFYDRGAWHDLVTGDMLESELEAAPGVPLTDVTGRVQIRWIVRCPESCAECDRLKASGATGCHHHMGAEIVETPTRRLTGKVADVQPDRWSPKRMRLLQKSAAHFGVPDVVIASLQPDGEDLIGLAGEIRLRLRQDGDDGPWACLRVLGGDQDMQLLGYTATPAGALGEACQRYDVRQAIAGEAAGSGADAVAGA